MIDAPRRVDISTDEVSTGGLGLIIPPNVPLGPYGQVVLDFRIPTDVTEAVVAGLGTEADPPGAQDFIFWTITTDGKPLNFYTLLRFRKGTQPIPYVARERVRPGELVQLWVRNTAGVNAYNVAGRIIFEF